LAKALGQAGDGVIVTQVVPHFDADLPAVRAYRAAIRAFDPGSEFSFGSLEGYLAARILCLALQTMPDEPSREKTIDALEGLGTFDLGLDQPLPLSKTEHQASPRVWPTVLRNGRYVPFQWEELAVPAGRTP